MGLPKLMSVCKYKYRGGVKLGIVVCIKETIVSWVDLENDERKSTVVRQYKFNGFKRYVHESNIIN